MTPAAILSDVRADGLTLVAEPGGTILVRGPAEARAHWLPAIRANKEALLLALVHTPGSQENFLDNRHDRHTVTPPPPLTAEDLEDIEEAVQERAAILEYDGGMSRVRAQEVAELAGAFYSHHWSCPTCRAGTQVGAGLHRPCPEGARLWSDYVRAAGRGVRP